MHACQANPSTGLIVRKQIDAFVVVVTNNMCDNNLFIVTNVLEEV